MYTLFIKKLLTFEKTHSSNSKTPEKINKKRIFCITNLIKTIILEIISKTVSFTMLLLGAAPRITTQKFIPKSINKLVGIVSIKNINKKKPPIAQIKTLLCIKIKNTDVKINKLIVKKKRTAKKK